MRTRFDDFSHAGADIELEDAVESVLDYEQSRLAEILWCVSTDAWSPGYTFDYLKGLVENHVELLQEKERMTSDHD